MLIHAKVALQSGKGCYISQRKSKIHKRDDNPPIVGRLWLVDASVAGQVDRSGVPLEIVGSSGHEESTHARKTGSGATRKTGERGSKNLAASTCGPHSDSFNDTSRRRRSNCSTNNFRHLAKANLKSKRSFRALPLTPEHQQLRLQW
ncbi:hypothetical protein TNCV_1697531 [Trichonephila clavipes]|nr:hypothetical protein TNCV_1697531 [Trichonephila clavipes]